jgi:hypothetical protein
MPGAARLASWPFALVANSSEEPDIDSKADNEIVSVESNHDFSNVPVRLLRRMARSNAASAYSSTSARTIHSPRFAIGTIGRGNAALTTSPESSSEAQQDNKTFAPRATSGSHHAGSTELGGAGQHGRAVRIDISEAASQPSSDVLRGRHHASLRGSSMCEPSKRDRHRECGVTQHDALSP